MTSLARGEGDLPSGLSWGRVRRSALRSVALALLIVYVGWNLFWITRGSLAPSLFQTLTGLPCATTGMTRGLQCLLAGRWLDSVAYNVFAAPLCLLFALSLGWTGFQVLRRRRPALPASICWAWLALLSAAWAFKLAGPVAYW